MNEVFKRINKVVTSMKPSQNFITIKITDAIDRVENGQKLFIKPEQIKLFSGMVFDNMCINILKEFPDNTEVYVSLPFESKILSEWRFYIRDKNIIDARNYSGDFTIVPNFKLANDLVKNNDKFPISYTMDIAILENNKNVIIEYNDMWAIGNYGMDNSDYYKLLRLRYFEIIKYE